VDWGLGECWGGELVSGEGVGWVIELVCVFGICWELWGVLGMDSIGWGGVMWC